ncbi:hypothetical protein GGI11_000241 [Coemansia sp. RSA 2049]|nr:hypothetical protein GGI11_000241 [Coemansia sp. RSA 2049]
MSSIPTDAVSYYAAYNLSGTEQSDGGESGISTGVTATTPSAQPLASHGFFHAQHPQHQNQTQGQIQIKGNILDPSATYQTGAFGHYAHAAAAYHTHNSAATPQSGTVADPTSGGLAVSAAAFDHDYSVISVAGAFNSTASPASHQHHHSHQNHSHNHIHTPQTPVLSHHAGAHMAAAIGDTATSSANTNPSPAANTLRGANMTFECILEAPTAAAEKVDTSLLTYLNKGQLYGVSIVDRTQANASYITTIRIAFHEESHRKSAATYWNFWLNQQDNPRAARAVELDRSGSVGVEACENKHFDRVAFQWHGRRGAKVMVRFNCLSTDFSRIKGVKGIPLRLHVDTHQAVPPLVSPDGEAAATVAMSVPVSPTLASGRAFFDTQHSQQQHSQQQQPHSAAPRLASATTANINININAEAGAVASGRLVERCYTRIKLFRDKGAERKNKDEQKQHEKHWERKKAKFVQEGLSATQQHQKLAEFTMEYEPVHPYTMFAEYALAGDACDAEEPVIIDNSIIGLPGFTLADVGASSAPVSVAYLRKRSLDDADALPSSKRQCSPPLSASITTATPAGTGPKGLEILGIDPTYVPAPRKKPPVLVVYAKFHGESVYRAIYLERLSAVDLASKLARRLELHTSSSSGRLELIHKTKAGLAVAIDDSDIHHLNDQQDMEVECAFAEDSGALTIYLHY